MATLACDYLRWRAVNDVRSISSTVLSVWPTISLDHHHYLTSKGGQDRWARHCFGSVRDRSALSEHLQKDHYTGSNRWLNYGEMDVHFFHHDHIQRMMFSDHSCSTSSGTIQFAPLSFYRLTPVSDQSSQNCNIDHWLPELNASVRTVHHLLHDQPASAGLPLPQYNSSWQYKAHAFMASHQSVMQQQQQTFKVWQPQRAARSKRPNTPSDGSKHNGFQTTNQAVLIPKHVSRQDRAHDQEHHPLLHRLQWHGKQ